jgi:biopolymer transport protein ExbD
MQAVLLPVRRRKAIGLTALIDVVFILLLFFMLTSTFNRWQAMDLQAPVTALQPLPERPLMALLKADMAVTLGGYSAAISELEQLVEQNPTVLDTSAVLVVIPEPTVNVQTIVTALETFKQLGWQQVSLGDVLATAESETQ